jgi:hypothetical protein
LEDIEIIKVCSYSKCEEGIYFMRDKKQFGLDPNKGIVEQLDKEAYKSIIEGAHYVVVVGVSYFHTEILNEMYELGYKFITADRDTKYFEKKE